MNARNGRNISRLAFAIITLIFCIQNISHAVSQPQFLDGASTIRSVAEHTPAGTNIGAPIEAEIPKKLTIRYRFALKGSDAEFFQLATDSSSNQTAQLQTKAPLDYEARDSYTVTLVIQARTLFLPWSDKTTITVTINVTDASDPGCRRTLEVQDAIVAAAGVVDCGDVTEKHLASIISLDLGNKGITTLKAYDFDGLSSLETLNLSDNRLSSLPADVFDELSSLKTLNLSGNQFSSLDADSFDDLSSLKTLDLSGNQFRSLSQDIFDEPSSLETLNLSDNRLSSLPRRIFNGLSLLKTLNLSDNQLTSLDEDSFDDLISLEELDVSSNRLSSLGEDILDELSSLETLNLSDNQLTSLDEDSFDDLSSLETLNLSDNRLSSLPVGVFNELSSLKWLQLHGNSVDLLSVTVSLEKTGDDQFKAVVPIGAPFDIVLPLNINGGTITTRETSIRVSTGRTESAPLVVTPNGSAFVHCNVSVGIGELPGIPSDHTGYRLVKSDDISLEFSNAVQSAPLSGIANLLDPATLKSMGPEALAAQLATLRAESDGSLRYLQAIALLESVLASKRPEETQLLANYPNPFNPETWIPYHLANTSNVQITIYDAYGTIVRQLDLGHQSAGYYTSRSHAAYWDGRNAIGERVASGVYFYQLQADKISPMRKMLILK